MGHDHTDGDASDSAPDASDSAPDATGPTFNALFNGPIWTEAGKRHSRSRDRSD